MQEWQMVNFYLENLGSENFGFARPVSQAVFGTTIQAMVNTPGQCSRI